MGESILFGIADNLLMKLGSSAFEHVAMMCGVKDEARKLCSTLTTIRAVLVDADDQREKSLLIENWIKNLKDVVYDIDDILDEFATKAPTADQYFAARTKTQVSRFFSQSNQLAFRYKVGRKIRNIRGRLDEIGSDMAKFSFSERCYNVRFGNRDREQTHSFVLATNVAGREEDKEELVKLLRYESNLENVSAIAIVGIGGLGKTTLAKLVFNDERIVKDFGLRIWIYDEFNVRSVMEKILASSGDKFENLEMELEALGKLEMEQLQQEVRRRLDGKKYLLVMDDGWNENPERWIQLNELLLGGARGSKIVVTTRSQKVAIAMDAECMYMLQGLSEDTSWLLFKQLAFRQGDEVKHPNLVGIGRNIAKKCYGVPLVLRTLGCMLRSIKKESEWWCILNNEIWELHDIMKVLKLSYDQLPSGQKQCFTYCSLFPKGFELETRSLILLWMAQGFINQLDAKEQMEEIGMRYFEELLLRCFFQDVKRDDDGNFVSCKMHDLMHDLACSIAKPEFCLAEADGRNVSDRVRHVSFATYLPWSWTLPPSLLRVKKLRTFLLPLQAQTGYRFHVEDVLTCFMRLRELDLHGQRIDKLSRAIGELIHLRYLDLSKNPLTTLPSTIGKLQNLQTLKLERCNKFIKLPVEITRIVCLRHLDISKCSSLTHMPLGIGELTSLRTLPRFILGKGPSISKCGALGELKYLNQLRGELCIANLEQVNDARECDEAKLKDKEHLYSLRLIWSREADGDNEKCDNDAVIMESLHPHKNLKELHISGYRATKLPMWMSATNISLLPNLVTVTIERCSKCLQLPSFEELPFLRVLKLYSLGGLIGIFHSSNASSYFPALEELVLFDLPCLSNWPRNEKQQCFPCLTKLMIIDCPKLLSLPCPPLLEGLVLCNASEQLRASLVHVQADHFQSS